jgi:hypothetical protein
LSFTDTNKERGVLAGTISILQAVNQSTIDFYSLWWGNRTNRFSLLTPPIAKGGKESSSQLKHYIDNDKSFASVGATHIHVYAGNQYGSLFDGILVPIVDVGIPSHTPTFVNMSDTDTRKGWLNGSFMIGRASVESHISHYQLYWAREAGHDKIDGNPRIGAPVAVGSNEHERRDLVVTLSDPVLIPMGANYIICLSANVDGEMMAGAYVALRDIDRAVPSHSARWVILDADTDTDFGELGGKVSIGRALVESDIVEYVVNFADSYKRSLAMLTRIAKTGSNLIYDIPLDTHIPAQAAFISVTSANVVGKSNSVTFALIADRGVPRGSPRAVSFKDLDVDANEIGGSINISGPVLGYNDSITEYVVSIQHEGISEEQLLGRISAAFDAGKPVSLVSFDVVAGTALIPPGRPASIVVRCANSIGVSRSFQRMSIVDASVPLHAPANVVFSDDLDLDRYEIEGTITIYPASDESDVSSYVLMWGDMNGVPLPSPNTFISSHCQEWTKHQCRVTKRV